MSLNVILIQQLKPKSTMSEKSKVTVSFSLFSPSNKSMIISVLHPFQNDVFKFFFFFGGCENSLSRGVVHGRIREGW